jgi:dTDP-4-dehydrorhamnose reductase
MRAQMKKTLIVGANGFIGKAFWNFYQGRSESPVGTSYKPSTSFLHLDLKQPDLTKLSIDLSQFSHAILTAGITNLKECEKRPDETYQCNVAAILHLAKQLIRHGIQPVIPSSDYVFDGKEGGYKENDPLNPLNQYGKQKQLLESLIQESFENFLILRLSKVFSLDGREGKTLLDEMAGKLKRGETIYAATDQVFCPIHIDDLVYSVDRLMRQGARGLFQVCSEEKVSRYDLACRIAASIDADPGLIRPISLDDLGESFIRPKRTDMSCRKLIQYANYVPRTITCCIEQLGKLHASALAQ